MEGRKPLIDPGSLCQGKIFPINFVLSRVYVLIQGRKLLKRLLSDATLILELCLFYHLRLVLSSNSFLVKRVLLSSASSRFNLTSQPDFCAKNKRSLKGTCTNITDSCKIYLRTQTATILTIRAISIAGMIRTWSIRTKILVIY